MRYSITEFETLYNTAIEMAMSLLHNEDYARDALHEICHTSRT